MKTTGNLGLKKPDGTDIVDITDLNGNMDVLDTAVKAVQDHAVDAVKHITAAERTAWNAKASTAAATTAAAGLMAAADKAKLDGVAAGANNYVHPNHTGDVTSTGDGVTAIAPGVIVNADINAAAAIDAAKIGTGVVSNAEFGYLDGVTGGIQGQLDSKLSKSGGTMGGLLNALWGVNLQVGSVPPESVGTMYADGANGGLFYRDSAKYQKVALATSADISYYVRTDGNDSNTGLANTAGGAFKTIGKAISMIPRIVNHAANIYIGAGTYAEKLTLKGFGGEGTLTVIGAVATRTVQSVEIINCTIVTMVSGFTCSTTTDTSVTVTSSTAAVIDQVNSTVNATMQAGISLNLSMARVVSCAISNKGRVMSAVNGAKAYAENFSGTGNVYGYVAELGGHISYAGTQASSTNGNAALTSGIINQEVLNPWGDNTTALRSGFRANLSNSQAIAANTTTKVGFNTKAWDNLSEYSAASCRFTSAKGGTYIVSTSTTILAVPPGTRIILDFIKNGGELIRMFDFTSGGGNDTAISGSAVMGFEAGGYVEVYVYIAGYSLNIIPSGSHFAAARIA